MVTRCLAGVPVLATGDEPCEVGAHLDCALRCWPAEEASPFDARRFEEELRAALRATAGSARAFSFGNDSLAARSLGHGFREVTAMVELCGLRPDTRPVDLWTR